MSQINIDRYNEIVSNSFGLWITGLFGNIRAYNKDISFINQKEVFFYIIRTLLDERKIFFEDPNSPFGSKKKWHLDTDAIIQYLLERWPEDARDQNDSSMLDYFYDEVPAILWVGEDGKIYAS